MDIPLLQCIVFVFDWISVSDFHLCTVSECALFGGIEILSAN